MVFEADAAERIIDDVVGDGVIRAVFVEADGPGLVGEVVMIDSAVGCVFKANSRIDQSVIFEYDAGRVQ